MIVSENNYSGLTYRISDSNGNQRGFLSGTIHGTMEYVRVNETIRQAMSESKQLVIELNYLEYEKEINDLIVDNPNLHEELELKRILAPKLGFIYESIEEKLIRIAKKHNIGISGLETMDERRKQSLKTGQEIFLGLKNLLSDEKELEKARAASVSIFNAFKNSSHELKKLLKVRIALESYSARKELIERNDLMACRTDALLKNNAMPFVAIGLDHLVQKPYSVVSLLRQKGWILKQVH